MCVCVSMQDEHLCKHSLSSWSERMRIPNNTGMICFDHSPSVSDAWDSEEIIHSLHVYTQLKLINTIGKEHPLAHFHAAFKVTNVPLIAFLPGWWPHDAAHSLDAPRKHHVPEVHHGEWCLEPGCCVVGDLHLWQAALVPTIQQWGTQWMWGRARSPAWNPKASPCWAPFLGWSGCNLLLMAQEYLHRQSCSVCLGAYCIPEAHGWSVVTTNLKVFWRKENPV